MDENGEDARPGMKKRALYFVCYAGLGRMLSPFFAVGCLVLALTLALAIDFCLL
jgi:hypothetical protein